MIQVIYHASDFDGKFSAILTKIFYEKINEKVNLIPMDHENKHNIYENYIKHFEKNDIVVLVDFSFDAKVMEYVNKNFDFIWIDHHISAINSCKSLLIAGIRTVEHSAVKLVWDYFFEDESHPFSEVVNYLSIYDAWQSESPLWNKAELFQNGLKNNSWDPRDINVISVISELLNDPDKVGPFVNEAFGRGYTIKRYNQIRNKEISDRNSFSCEFQGYSAIVINGHGNSQVFDSIDLTPYEIRMLYSFNGSRYVFSVFQGNPVDDVDCSEIAKRNGGGGHKGAAGFDVGKVEFKLNDSSKLEMFVEK